MARLPTLKPKNENPDLRLIEASINNNSSKLMGLIKERVNINDADAIGITALIMASSAGNLETVKILLKHDANKKSVDSLGYNAYKATMFYGDFHGVTNEHLIKL